MFRRLCLWIFWLAVQMAHGERLPVRVYPMADGLQSIYCIVNDSRGFLWFCTSEGLYRFDGERYTHFGVEHGLPNRTVVDFLETRDGELWAATSTSLCHLRPHSFAARSRGPTPFFEVYRLPPDPRVRQPVGLAESPDGGIWFVTHSDLFRFDRRTKAFQGVEQYPEGVSALFADRDGGLWLGQHTGVLVHRWADGRSERFGAAEGLPLPLSGIYAIYRDREERLWVGTWRGLCLMTPHPQPGKASVARVLAEREGLPGHVVQAIHQTREGRLWVGVLGGLAEIIPGNGGQPDRILSYTAQKGLNVPDEGTVSVTALAEDAGGNLWMTPGPMRVAMRGLTTYTVEDGLRDNSVGSIREDREGRLVVTAGVHTEFLQVLRGGRFAAIAPKFPKWIDSLTWGATQVHMQDHTGAWWVPTGKGLCRYPSGKRVEDLASTMPEHVYTSGDGLPGNDIYRLYEDSRGDLWISVVGPNVVTLWSRAENRFQNFKEGDGDKALGTPTAFAEDRSGGIWMGFYWRDMARYFNGRFRVFTTDDGLPTGVVQALFVDHAGRLWAATSGGLVRIEDPTAERPQFRIYHTGTGLSSNHAGGITEDAWGRIYVATNGGVDRIEPETGQIRHYGQADGIPWAGQAYRDRQGALWFGSIGLKRFLPQADDGARTAPPIRITRLTVHGNDVPISELGESQIAGLRLAASQTPIEIHFASVNFDFGETIRYQYKLGASDWDPPVNSTSVTYANIAPGKYRFEVRAINSEGLASATPTYVAFAVLPPWYESWWSLSLGVLLLSTAIWAAHRNRLRHALALERVRTRIATDLHDDIGSSLTQIAILSEVARKHVETDAAQAATPLTRIADLSRELVDSMSDIVWAINPRRDHLGDLVYRMRRFGNDVFPARNIEFEFRAPADGEDMTLHAEIRREVFLVFKECVHNILRHSGCRRAEFGLRVQQHRLYLWVRDDGKGMTPPGNGHGHGLASMEQRVRSLGGHWEILSEPGQGTEVSVDIPMGRANPRPLPK